MLIGRYRGACKLLDSLEVLILLLPELLNASLWTYSLRLSRDILSGTRDRSSNRTSREHRKLLGNAYLIYSSCLLYQYIAESINDLPSLLSYNTMPRRGYLRREQSVQELGTVNNALASAITMQEWQCFVGIHSFSTILFIGVKPGGSAIRSGLLPYSRHHSPHRPYIIHSPHSGLPRIAGSLFNQSNL